MSIVAQRKLPVYEYSPNQIKLSLAGYGVVTKTQMEEMVRIHLGFDKKPKPDDAADALAVAITCGFLYREGMDNDYRFSNSRGRKRG